MEDWEGWENGQERPRAYQYNQISGYIRPVSDAELRHNAAVQQVFGYAFWLGIMGMIEYYLITHYAWTTAAVVMGVLVLFSLFTVGIRRTAGGIIRFIWWAILMAVMTDVVVRVGGSYTDNAHGVLLPFLAVVLMFAVWLYSTVKITRLVF